MQSSEIIEDKMQEFPLHIPIHYLSHFVSVKMGMVRMVTIYVAWLPSSYASFTLACFIEKGKTIFKWSIL